MKQNITEMNSLSVNNLDNATFLFIQELSETVDLMYKSLSTISIIERQNNDLKGIVCDVTALVQFKKLVEYNLLISLIGLDIACAVRVYSNAKVKYEVLYSAKHIVIILNEGYKKIYNYVSKNIENSDPFKHRNNSFWVKEIGKIVKGKDLASLQFDYNNITNRLNKYFGEHNDSSTLQRHRNLAVHYDDDPSKVYDMLTTLDIEDVFKKALPFLQIINNMTIFCKLALELIRFQK